MNLLHRPLPSPLPVRAIQFGEGNFMRAFIDWMLHEMNRKHLFNGQVLMVQPQSNGKSAEINAQDGLYTLILRGVADGKIVEKREVIESVNGCLNPYTQWRETVEAMKLDTVRFVFSNTTEAGIAYQPEPYTPGVCQTTYPAKLTALVFERFKAGGKGLVFIPCELIDRNGMTLKKYMLQYAADWHLPSAFSDYLEHDCAFYNTLVDRIVPGYPKDEAAQLESELGYLDRLIDCGEIFHFFVLEGSDALLRELPFDQCGLNVVVTADQTPYRTRKVRFLNGAHTANVLAAALAGITFVDEMMNDADFGELVRQSIFDEIYHTVALPDAEKKFFAESVVERFLNPFAKHRLLSISLNSVSKWKVRVLPSLLDYLETRKALPPALAFSLAALLRFYRLADETGGRCAEVSYPVTDAPEVMAFFRGIRQEPNAAFAAQALGNTAFWGMDLNTVPGLAKLVTEKLDLIDAQGIRAAARSVLSH